MVTSFFTIWLGISGFLVRVVSAAPRQVTSFWFLISVALSHYLAVYCKFTKARKLFNMLLDSQHLAKGMRIEAFHEISSWTEWSCRIMIGILFVLFLIFFFSFLGPLLTAYGGSQARGRIEVVATGLRQNHSNAGSEPCLWPTPRLTATPDP